jgi:activating signal cointegrator complex subunit 3
MSDCAFIAQSASRIARGLFAIALAKSWVSYAEKVLKLSKMLERRVWWNMCPLRQIGGLPQDIYQKLEAKRYVSAARIEALREMGVRELGQLVSNQRQAAALRAEAAALPALAIEVSAQPITRTVLRVTLRLTAAFEWRERVHGGSESWWIWVEDSDTEHIYHKELWTLSRRQSDEVQELTFTTPLFEPLPPAYYVRAFSDRWLGVETVVPLPLAGLALPSARPTHTELLPLRPLPKSALGDPSFEKLFRFSHFNPVQTQIFHTVMHTDVNVLVGAPTGSGKTVTAELAVMRLLREHPGMKAVYIAPLKALVRERMADWKAKFVDGLGLRMQELTGDVTPDGRALASAHLLATTPEKWDGVSRHWQQRNYVRQVGLVIIDEIHLLGEERGPILEVIVSRMRYMAEKMGAPVRIVGLSTAMANASDLADWLGIPHDSIFNFKPSVRPVPLEVHIAGFPGQHYCPRMAAMNKPTYRAITVHSPGQPALVFVSSRRQTRLTALDLIAYCSADERESQFLAVPLSDLEPELAGVRDPALRHTLAFGIGIHHAGLEEPDRVLVERLFLRQAILVLVCTSTLAWGVNFPAHLVVVKGTEYYDGKTKRYVDFPVTDVLQMMGRAGRPQFDDKAVAVILVHEPKKTFYKKFLYEPFPVESCLHEQLHNHINAEVVGGTIRSKQDAVDFLSWTYFYRRLLQNPAYYHCAEPTDDGFNRHLSSLVEATLADLEAAGCVQLAADGLGVEPLQLGRVASHYYLQYTTVALFHAELHDVDEPPTALPELLRILSDASEFDELPVRHNEEHVNAALAGTLPWPVDERALDSPHVKAQLLLQAHFAGAALPMSDYVTDLKSVLDQALRVLQAMVDIAADAGWLYSALGAMHLTQMVSQGRFLDGPQLSHLPGIDGPAEAALAACGLRYLPQLIHADARELARILSRHVHAKSLADLTALLGSLPATTLVAEPPPDAVAVGADCALAVTVGATNPRVRRSAHAPGFPKARAGGWWLVLGEGEELFALKRISAPASERAPPLKTELLLCAPEEPGTYRYNVYLVSDSYIGLDQQTTVTLVVE